MIVNTFVFVIENYLKNSGRILDSYGLKILSITSSAIKNKPFGRPRTVRTPKSIAAAK